MKLARGAIVVLSVSILLFFVCDALLGAMNVHLVLTTTDLEQSEKRFRIKHPVFHHTLAPNVATKKAYWSYYYELCTDENGFKSPCSQKVNSRHFDIAFIGDSFTEGVGLPYEKTFVGMFAKNNPTLKIANLGVVATSPTIYLSKVKYYIEKGFKFDHVIAFIDVSDVQNEALLYFEKDGVVVDSVPEPNKLKLALRDIFPHSYFILKILKDYVTKTAVWEDPAGEWTYRPYSHNYGPKGVSYGMAKSLKKMTELYEYLKARNIKLSVGVYPWPNQLKHDTAMNQHQKQWQQFCQNRCEMFIDANKRFFDYLARFDFKKTVADLFIPGDLHFNATGNELVYRTLQKAYDTRPRYKAKSNAD